MDNKNLEYLFNSIMNMNRNYYKNSSVGDNTSHTNYLNSRNISYSYREISGSRKTFVIKDPSGNELFNFRYPLYTNNKEIALLITKDKFKSEKHFTRCGFNTTISNVYPANDVESAFLETFKNNQARRVVLKPLNSSLGKGVFVNVSSENFKDTWDASLSDLSNSEKKNINNMNYLVQDIIEGFEARVTIMQGTLVSITVRIPPYVIGDGRNTVKQLISNKNKLRNNCSFQRRSPIIITKKIEFFLSSNNQSINYIPENNEPVLLSSVSNISAGGELFDITDLVSNDIKEFSLDVIASIPGMYSGGLDIILEKFDDPHPYILEANVYPNLSIPRHPTYGTRRNPSKILIDSLISQHQVNYPSDNRYTIENESELLNNFLSFIKRKEKYSESNYFNINLL